MLRRSNRFFLLTPHLVGVTVGGAGVSFEFTRASTARAFKVDVCPEWIFDNATALRHRTGQKLSSLDDVAAYRDGTAPLPPLSSAGAKICRDRGVVEFLVDKTAAAAVALPVDKVEVRLKDVEDYLAGRPPLPRYVPLPNVESVHRVDFSRFTSTRSVAHCEALLRLARDGLILVRGCPLDDATVTTLARCFDQPEMHTLYGTTFKVVSAPKTGPKNNVAYTTEELDLHQDLAYYESIPGLQLLHCQKFDKGCTGGESTFLDIINVAERLKARAPRAFETLTQVPAAFMKDDLDRPIPAKYYYATPHIHTDDFGNITKVFWSPPFEAPLPATDRMAEYYAARREFARELAAVRATPFFLQLKMEPGDCAIFHQARLLHGRRGFFEPEPGARMLHGAYVNVDAFRNAVITRALALRLPIDDLPGFANKSYR